MVDESKIENGLLAGLVRCVIRKSSLPHSSEFRSWRLEWQCSNPEVSVRVGAEKLD